MLLYENKNRDFYYRSEQTSSSHLQCNAHIHRHIEFVYIRGGRGVGHADSEICDLGKDDLFVIFPNQVNRFETIEREEYDLFIVNPEMVPELSNYFNNAVPQKNVIRRISEKPEIFTAIKELSAAAKRPDSELREPLLKGRLLVLFCLVFGEMSITPYKKGDGNTLRTIVHYCANNFTQNLSLAQLEEDLHISKHYISHLFGDKLNIGFNDYINSLRITYAARLLRETNDPIIDVSENSGFNSLRTFNRAFKKHMGISPRDYRNNKNAARYSEIRSPSL